MFEALQVLNTFQTFDVMAGTRDPPHTLVPGCGIVIVQAHGFEVGPDRFGGNAGIVPGHFVKQVVDDVRTANRMMEPIKNAVIAINRRQGAPDPGPFRFTIVGNTGIGMLQPRVEDQPGIDEKVGVPVPQQDGQKAKFGGAHVHDPGQGGHRGGGRQGNLERNLVGEHGRRRSEVIGNAPETCQTVDERLAEAQERLAEFDRNT